MWFAVTFAADRDEFGRHRDFEESWTRDFLSDERWIAEPAGGANGDEPISSLSIPRRGGSYPSLTFFVGRNKTLMKRKILFTVLWTVIFAVVTLVVGIVGFAILGGAGLASWRESTVVFIGRTWSIVFFLMPVLGLVLSLF